MEGYKVLNMKGVLLDRNQLESYLAKLASDNVLKSKSDKNTYPIPRLRDNFEYITQVYNVLTDHLKLGIPIHPAGEWILDNYYIIEKTVKTIIKDMPLQKYTSFLGLENEHYKGFARVYVLASEIVSYTDGIIDRDNISNLLEAYQSKKSLSMEEIWNIGIFLQIALIENIRRICEKILSSQMQKYKVENIIERLVESKDDLKFKNISKTYGYGEMKYPFIEHMSYRLKQYGKSAYAFLNILEEQVDKMGLSISEVIRKEHFDIAVKKISMGNSITSINTILRVNFLEIFEQINGVEEVLKKDPSGVYSKMDYKTRAYYRQEIEKISKKTKISEMYIVKKCLELSEKSLMEGNNTDNKKSHIGYYLIDDGKAVLLSELLNKKIKKTNVTKKMKVYIYGIAVVSLLISFLCALYIYSQTKSILLSLIILVLTLIPSQTITVQLIQYVLSKVIKPKMLPKLDFKAGVPEDSATMVIIPTIVKDSKKVQELFAKLEVFYIANKSDNLYFTLLGDCSSSSNKEEKYDKEIIEAGIAEMKKLNEKYADNTFNKFNFIYRERVWNDGEGCYLGWERKRGAINQFNEYLLGNIDNPFLYNSFESDFSNEIGVSQSENDDVTKNKKTKNNKIPKIKYIITLDSDTDLVLNSGTELIGAMAHILNKPVLDENKNIIVGGHALMQPRVGIGLLEVCRSKFSKIFSGLGGTDSYINAIFDVYQDNFDEGIFTGKGIYDLRAFSQVLKNEIPENTVLSHDLLEGSYLRCGMVSDVMLMDGYPTNYLSFKKRLHRWIRGDYQILRWVQNKKINILSKYKIVDNILRSKLETSILTTIIVLLLMKITNKISIWPIALFLVISLTIPYTLEILNRIIFKKEDETIQKTFIKNQGTIQNSIIKGILTIMTLPDKAYMACNAEVKTIYRMLVSKKHMLEWVTAEEAEKSSKNDVKNYYANMISNLIAGILGIVLILIFDFDIISNIVIIAISALWIIAPFIMYTISKPIKAVNKIETLEKQEQKYFLDIAKKTWQFFKEYINEKTNYLPPDNYQEDRKPKIVLRTSSTNIGLGMLSIISSYDLGFENLEDTVNLLEKTINTVCSLQKWNGHLYNWYNLTDLQPLTPRFISSVDSGNLVGYFYVVLQFLQGMQEKIAKNVENKDFQGLEKIIYENENEYIKANNEYTKVNNKYTNANNQNTKVNNKSIRKNNDMLDIASKIIEKAKMMSNEIKNLINNTDFSKLYDYKNNLFSVGFDVEENKLVDSYYDLLASEARQASLIAIAKKDVDVKNWYNLSRTLTVLNKYKGLVSWSGTAFEYLMPNINIPKYPGSLLDESCKFMIMSQKEYSKKLGVPWGISESAFNLKDLNNNYQYKAFGIPWLGLKRGLADEVVISSYGSILAITEDPKGVFENLKKLEENGMYSKYGFYEAIDFTPNRVDKHKKYETVKTYMAHHQGLILLSINNLFNDNILQKRFMKNPEMQAINILLEERMPGNVIIAKEKKEKVEKIKYNNYDFYEERVFTKVSNDIDRYNLISNKDYTIVIDNKGNGYSKYKDILVNRYKPTSDIEQGVHFYVKNIKNKKIWTNAYSNLVEKPDKYSISFAPDVTKIVRVDGNIETDTKITVSPSDSVEIRRIEIKNLGNMDEMLEISSFIEPILSTKAQDYAHPAFNNLFLSYEFINETNTILVKRKKRNEQQNEIYMAVNLYSSEKGIGELEYEISKEKFMRKK